jgi:Cu(I)/Ag(I) efflux system membrane fusion protein
VKTSTIVSAVVLLGAVGAGSYWLGARSQQHPPEVSVASAASAPAAAPKQRKLLYYRNPMGLADTSPTPKKDPMGMDYIPVYEGEDESTPGAEAASPNQVRISTEKIQKLGVRTEPASMRLLGKTVRAAGRIEPDERRVFAVTAKFEGYVERLHVNATGQPVAKGQPLFEAYSPELVAAQREYAIAMQGLEAMKDAGVVVYSVGFDLGGNATAENFIKKCATSSDHVYLPSGGGALKDAFASIGKDIMKLRLSK